MGIFSNMKFGYVNSRNYTKCMNQSWLLETRPGHKIIVVMLIKKQKIFN